MSGHEDIEKRRREDAALRLETQFELYVLADEKWKREQEQKYEADKKISLEWRTEIEKQLKPLRSLYQTMTTPAHVIRAVLIMMAIPVLGIWGIKLGKWFWFQLEKIAAQ